MAYMWCANCRKPLVSNRSTYCSGACRQAAYRQRHNNSEDYRRCPTSGEGLGVVPAQDPCLPLDSVTAQSHSVTDDDATVTGDALYAVLLSELEQHDARGGTLLGYSTVMRRVFRDLGLGTGTGRVLRRPIGTYAERVRMTGPHAGKALESRSPTATEPSTFRSKSL